MTLRSWLNLALVAAVMTVLSVAAIVVPPEDANTAVVLAVLLFAAAVGFLFYVPQRARGTGEAVNLAFIGPVGALSAALLVWSAVSVGLALHGFTTASFAMDAVAVGGFVIAWSLLRAASPIIGQAARISETRSQHGTWQVRLSALLPLCEDGAVHSLLSRMTDDLRYTARDAGNTSLAENARITDLIDGLEMSLKSREVHAALAQIHKIRAALSERENTLLAARSKT